MVRASKKTDAATDDERTRLKKLAISRNLLSQTPSNPTSTLVPSKTVLKHHGKDIVKKSQRKNRFLFSFPGLLGPITGGKIGELKDLGTKKPILYLDFPQGRLKLFGTIVHPKNRYLTLQFSKGGKNVMCEDHFDNMVVFSDAWWIGSKDENPEEAKLDFPENLSKDQNTEIDFKGGAGAGAASEQKPVSNKLKKDVEPQSPSAEIEDVSEDSGSVVRIKNDLMEVTPVRQSSRTAGRKFKFTEPSSGDSSAENESDTSEMVKDEVKEELDDVNDSVSVATKTDLLEQEQKSSLSIKSKEVTGRKPAPLVQATISNLFEKAKEKTQDRSRRNATPVKGKNSGIGSNTKRKQSQVEDDDIEEFSSESEDIEESDEEWAA